MYWGEGSIRERSNRQDLRSCGNAFVGSNPTATKLPSFLILSLLFLTFIFYFQKKLISPSSEFLSYKIQDIHDINILYQKNILQNL